MTCLSTRIATDTCPHRVDWPRCCDWWVRLPETVLRACHNCAAPGKRNLFSGIDRWGLRWGPSVLWCLLSTATDAEANKKDQPP